MKQKTKKYTVAFSVALFWILIWEIFSLIVGVEYILPSPFSTAVALIGLLGQAQFYVGISLSILRVLLGFLIGVILGAILAVAAEQIKPIHSLVAPLVKVIKSTPVASIIIILWVILGGRTVPIAISALMVLPIIWQNVTDGFSAIDHGMMEVAAIYKFSYLKRLRLIIIPTIAKFLFPGIITSSGLAWKAGIAAEIICMAKNSIGRHIYDAKYVLDAPSMYAWTAMVVILSILLEKLISFIISSVNKNVYHN